ncbi:MAG: hypothetical protein HY781_05925 [Chloroflexi bacterium]|nr:hypothetical protein [Chloroflexota bacterium]
MKKSLYIVMAIALFATLLVGCGGGNVTLGDTLITVKGDIGKTNSGDNYILDQAAFDELSVELTYNDPWMGDGLNYKGILLSDLVGLVDPSADVTIISLIATDGKAFDIAIADAEQYDIMLARWVDGNLLDESNGGPVKVAYPDDAKATYPDEQWAWWVVSVEFK